MKNRYEDGEDDDDFDERFEEFCAMTEAEQESAIAREMAEYNRWIDGMTQIEAYRFYRRSALFGCLTWRSTIRMLKAEPGSIFHGYLRDRQKRLLKLRIKLATGIRPGSA